MFNDFETNYAREELMQSQKARGKFFETFLKSSEIPMRNQKSSTP